jgi:phage terminase small subunit
MTDPTKPDSVKSIEEILNIAEPKKRHRDTPLTPKIQRCGNFYLKGMSMRQAMIQAGYTEQYAETHCTDFFKNRKLIQYIRDRQKAVEEATLVDEVFVLNELKKIINDPSASLKDRNDAIKTLNDRITRSQEINAKLEEIKERNSNLAKEEDKNIIIKIEGLLNGN